MFCFGLVVVAAGEKEVDLENEDGVAKGVIFRRVEVPRP